MGFPCVLWCARERGGRGTLSSLLTAPPGLVGQASSSPSSASFPPLSHFDASRSLSAVRSSSCGPLWWARKSRFALRVNVRSQVRWDSLNSSVSVPPIPHVLSLKSQFPLSGRDFRCSACRVTYLPPPGDRDYPPAADYDICGLLSRIVDHRSHYSPFCHALHGAL